MIALIDTMITANCDAAMRGMFAARKEVFVDLLGWKVPVLDGRFELDQFDDEHARYLILTDGELGHLGSARLLPSTRPHILDTLFPALCAGPIPRASGTWEITRFCLDRKLSAARRREIRNMLVTGIVLHALAQGIDSYTGVAESAWLNQILAFGWDASPLGQPLSHGASEIGALRIRISAETPALLDGAGIWSPIQRVGSDIAPVEG